MKKGNLVFWEISDLATSKDALLDVLNSLGVSDPSSYIPRNDFKTALIRALRVTLRADEGDDKFYRRFNDKAESASFAVLVPEFFGGDVEFRKETVITVDKTTGALTYDSNYNPVFQTALQEQYEQAKKTLDAAQFRTLLLRLIREECYGVAIRKAGGVYYIADKDLYKFEKIRKLFQKYPEKARLEEIPVYDDSETVQAIQQAVTNEMLGELISLKNDLLGKVKDKKLSDTILRNRRAEIDGLISKVEHHRNDLLGQHESLSKTLSEAKEAISKILSGEADFDLESALNALAT